MSKLGQLMGKVTGTVRQAERGGRGAGGKTDRNIGGRQAGGPVPPPELPLDDDGNDARNIGG